MVLEVETYEMLCALSNHEDGEIAYCTDTKKYYMYKDGAWQPVEAKMTSDGLQLNLYELNKQVVSQLPDFDDEKIEEFKKVIAEWKGNRKAFLLVGKEIGYYTVFIHTDTPEGRISESIEDLVIECLGNVAPIKSYEVMDENAIEIWLSIEDATVLYLINYEEGIVKFNE